MSVAHYEPTVFIDWLTASQFHPEGGLPIISGGVVVNYDASGAPVFERNKPARFQGSHETGVSVGCDGFRVFLSGNPGRVSRPDNVFSFGIAGTIEAANRILGTYGLPAFTPAGFTAHGIERRGCVVSRLDITRNYATGNEATARHFIQWLAGRSIARMRRGFAGNESVWWANTRHMLKAYIKHLEMLKHGAPADSKLVEWLREKGVVRVEVELKKRLLSELSMNDLGDITDEKLEALFDDQTAIFHSADRSGEEDILDHLPQRSRVYAAAWLAGKDMKSMASERTLFRHAKVLRECGIDILQTRNVTAFPVKVRTIELQPLRVSDAPSWYSLERAA